MQALGGTLLPNLRTDCHRTSACRKETHCEFCDSVLPDWKITLTPPCGADAPAVMNVNFDGEGMPAWLPCLMVGGRGRPEVRLLSSVLEGNLPGFQILAGEGAGSSLECQT